MERKGPHYNLKAVVQQTGLKPDTLRAWERRYGLPTPERSGGGHRLYTHQDIETIKWLMSRQREGLSIKRAVETWRQIEADGRNPLDAPMPLPALATPVRAEGATLVQMRQSWTDACLAYDEARAELVLAEAFALYTPETVCLELLQKALSEIGEGWYRGEIAVQQEHFCSALAVRRVEAMVLAAPPATRPGRILAANPPQEEHVFGLLLLTYLLRRRGWDVVYLGANVPVDRLETTIAATHPQLVIMAAQQLHSAATLREAAGFLQQAGVSVAYGGLVFNLLPELRQRIAGHFLGGRLDAAQLAVERLMTAPSPVPSVEPVSEAHIRARDHFLQRQGFIEADLNQIMARSGGSPTHLAVANRQFSLNIVAGLSLGDLDYLGSSLHWIKGLLDNHHLPPDALRQYLVAYHRAADKNLDHEGALVVSWLGKLLDENGLSAA